MTLEQRERLATFILFNLDNINDEQLEELTIMVNTEAE